MTLLGRGLYRVEQVALFEQTCSFGDIARFPLQQSDGGGRSLRGSGRALAVRTTTHTFALARPGVEAPHVQAVLARVMSLGGHWECSFGGVLSICLLPGEEYDPSGSMSDVRP
ncbi:MAG: hypothetical protein R3F34_15500 [Planctomycetota bacterium]